MSRPIYVPIADSFFESSIMREELPVRFVMLALIRLALRAGANGEVDIDPQMFALSINLPLPLVEAAIHRLMEPDPSSSSPDEDGRRLVPVDPSRPFRNWRLVNWTKYRHIVHLANDAARKREDRHDKQDITDASENVQKRPGASVNGGNGATNTNTNTNTNTKNEEDIRITRFEKSFWFVFPRKVGKAQALKAWLKLSDEERILADEGIREFAGSWTTRPPEEIRFCPHAATWLSGKRWEDKPEPLVPVVRAVVHKTQRDIETETEVDQIQRNREADANRHRKEEDNRAADAEWLEKNWKKREEKP